MKVMDKPGLSGRKLVLGCAVFFTLLTLGGVVWVFKETARIKDRREVLFQRTGVDRISFEFLGGAIPARVAPPIDGDSPIAYWEVFTVQVAFDKIVEIAKLELERVDPSMQPPITRGGVWEHTGAKLQVLILKEAAFPEFNGQGDQAVFPDLPPFVRRADSVVVRVNYKRR